MSRRYIFVFVVGVIAIVMVVVVLVSRSRGAAAVRNAAPTTSTPLPTAVPPTPTLSPECAAAKTKRERAALGCPGADSAAGGYQPVSVATMALPSLPSLGGGAAPTPVTTTDTDTTWKNPLTAVRGIWNFIASWWWVALILLVVWQFKGWFKWRPLDLLKKKDKGDKGKGDKAPKP
jgi:hypothetical protein